jgi:hypothetical protein
MNVCLERSLIYVCHGRMNAVLRIDIKGNLRAMAT